MSRAASTLPVINSPGSVLLTASMIFRTASSIRSRTTGSKATGMKNFPTEA